MNLMAHPYSGRPDSVLDLRSSWNICASFLEHTSAHHTDSISHLAGYEPHPDEHHGEYPDSESFRSRLIGIVGYITCPDSVKLSSHGFQSISDDRIKKTRELVQGIKLLKILGWERIFVEKIQQIRSKERGLLKKDTIFVAMNSKI